MSELLSQYTWVIYIVIFVAFVYFFMIRPQKKRVDDQRTLLNSLTDGTRIMLASGIIGTVRAIGEEQIVVEFAPGVEVTVVKAAVARVLGSEDEEFEYSDEPVEAEAAAPAEIEPPEEPAAE
jgi:preprotein translocase subunit YajC